MRGGFDFTFTAVDSPADEEEKAPCCEMPADAVRLSVDLLLRKLQLHLESMAIREAISGNEGKMYHASILAEDLPAWAWQGARRHHEQGGEGPWQEEMALLHWCLAQVEGCWTRGDEPTNWGTRMTRDQRMRRENDRLVEQQERDAAKRTTGKEARDRISAGVKRMRKIQGAMTAWERAEPEENLRTAAVTMGKELMRIEGDLKNLEEIEAEKEKKKTDL